VFHDAYKGWSCCTKKSTDFSEFLNIPGCTKSEHSNVKPVEPVKEKPVEVEIPSVEERKAPELTPRPTVDEPLVEIKRTVSPSLTAALLKLNEKLKEITIGN
jgi:cysteine/histidine-rich domain-containing protein 1